MKELIFCFFQILGQKSIKIALEILGSFKNNRFKTILMYLNWGVTEKPKE